MGEALNFQQKRIPERWCYPAKKEIMKFKILFPTHTALSQSQLISNIKHKIIKYRQSDL